MIFLIDNQLPAGLAAHIQSQGLDAKHVSAVGLESATDQHIWDYAKVHDCAVVTKDEDFLFLSSTDPSGPVVVWVRLGNCRNKVLFEAFDRILPRLQEAIAGGAKVIEVR